MTFEILVPIAYKSAFQFRLASVIDLKTQIHKLARCVTVSLQCSMTIVELFSVVFETS